MRVYDFNEAADLGAISRRHLERLVASGKGPATVRISPGRIGILEDDWRIWLLANRRMSLGQENAEEAVFNLMKALRSLAPSPDATSNQIPRASA